MCSPSPFPFPFSPAAFAGGQGLCCATHCHVFGTNNSAQGAVLPITWNREMGSVTIGTHSSLPASGTHLAPVVSEIFEGKLKEWLSLGRRALNSKSILNLYKDTTLIWLEMWYPLKWLLWMDLNMLLQAQLVLFSMAYIGSVCEQRWTCVSQESQEAQPWFPGSLLWQDSPFSGPAAEQGTADLSF